MSLEPTQIDPRQQLLITLVERAVELMADDQEVDVEVLCADHPEMASEVARVLDLQRNVGSLQRAAREIDPLLQTTLAGRYRIAQRLGAGAMGAVYLARDEELHRDVAVKVLRTHLFAEQELSGRFDREAQALANLRHQHIVAIHDRGRTPDGTMYLVMDALSGAPLADILARAAALTESGGRHALYADVAWLHEEFGIVAPAGESFLRLCVRWGADIASALHAAHEARVLHRDLKPSNVFITRDARAVLLDFGLAKRTDEAALTMTGQIVGTPAYMAPEQVVGGELAPATDVYGLAATLYHLVTLAPPFEGGTAHVLSVIPREDPRPAAELHPGLSRDLVAILDRGLERDSSRRYPTAHAFGADLRAFLDHLPVTARPLTKSARMWRRVRRQPARLAAAIAIAVLVLVVPFAWYGWWRGLELEQLENAQQKAGLVARLPSRLALEGWPDQRLLVPREERSGYVRDLDDLLALDPEDLPVRLLRAAQLLDRGGEGDVARAAEDLDVVAQQSASVYLREVAERYRAAGDGERGTMAVDLDGMTHRPQTAQECFVAGFHELRNRHVDGFAGRALELLDRGAQEYVPARDLRVLAYLALIDYEPGRKTELAQTAHDEALVLEGMYGMPTARTCSVRGTALVVLGRYREAIECLRESLRLRPGRHGPLQNLGVAYFRLADLDNAERYLREAHEVRPWLWNTLYQMSLVYTARGEFDRAFAAAEKIDAATLGSRAFLRSYALGRVRQSEALHSKLARDEERQAACVADAVAWFDRAIEEAPAAWETKIRGDVVVAESLEHDDLRLVSDDQMQQLIRDPLNPIQLDNLVRVLPEQLDARGTDRLRAFLLALRDKVAPDYERLARPESRTPVTEK